MQVPHNKDLASHVVLESCAAHREVRREALAEARIGQPLSLAKIHILGADAVAKAEGNMDGRVSASVWTARRGRRTWHVQKLLGREPGDPTSGQPRCTALARIGKARSRSR